MGGLRTWVGPSVVLSLFCLEIMGCDLFGTKPDLVVEGYRGPTITRENSDPGWSGKNTDGTVVIRYVGSPSTEGSTCFFTLSKGSSGPRLDEVWCGDTERAWRGGRLDDVRLWLQDWNPDGVVSGMAHVTRKGYVMQHYFWVDVALGFVDAEQSLGQSRSRSRE